MIERYMTEKNKHLYCPLSMAGLLDSKLRRFLFNPSKILKPYIKKNMVALDFGCGPGVYTYDKLKILFSRGIVLRKI